MSLPAIAAQLSRLAELDAATETGWEFDASKGWTVKPEYQERYRAEFLAEMAAIDARQADAPTCALCGQRANRLDQYGLCSKISKPHIEWRRQAAAEEARARR